IKRGEISERIIDTGEDGGTLTTVADIHETHYKRLRDSTKANSTHRVQLAYRIVAQLVRDPPRLGERCDFQSAMGAEQVRVVNPVAHLDVCGEQIVVDVAAGAETAQRLLIGKHGLVAPESGLCPEGHLIARRLVLHEQMTSKGDPWVYRVVLACLVAETGVGE